MLNSREMNKSEIMDALESGIGPIIAKVALAALSSVPIVGSFVGAAGTAYSEYDQKKYQKILISWLKLQEYEVREIGQTLAEVVLSIDHLDELVVSRIESLEYLSLVKKCFRDWSAAESEEKRGLIRNLLVSAAAVNQKCSDDIIRMFITWIDTYSESHFRIIREIFMDPGVTRFEMWMKIHGARVREDSAEADLFKLLIHELSLGMIIRQYREKDGYGNFIKSKSRKPPSNTQIMKSAFDDDKEYHLTELGKWFVHYTMNEIIPKIEQTSRVSQQE